MLRRLMLGLGALALTGALSVSTALAQAPTAKQSLVALGDSITYGYNLNTNVLGDVNNHHSSRDAFPYLIGNNENMRVRDLGVPGWTSQQLLTALQTNEKYRQAVMHANVITIDIGSNDLLHILKTSKSLDQKTLSELSAAGINLVTDTLPMILQQVRYLNPSATVILYNIYNPFPADPSSPTDMLLNALGNDLLPSINLGIEGDAASYQVEYADVFDAFSGHQSDFVIPGGVHPSIAGQRVLAQVGEHAFVPPLTTP